MDFLFGTPTHWWFWATLIFTVIEFETFGLISIWFIFGAMTALFTSLFVSAIPIQILVFLVVSSCSMLLLRQIAFEKLKNFKTDTNVYELIGQTAEVFTAILPNAYGEVKLQGKIWRTKSDSESVYEVGDAVQVNRIVGSTIYVD